jgi:hypothetical protein
MFIPDPVLDFLPHPGSRGHKGTGSRIRNTVWKNDRQAKFQQPLAAVSADPYLQIVNYASDPSRFLKSVLRIRTGFNADPDPAF